VNGQRKSRRSCDAPASSIHNIGCLDLDQRTSRAGPFDPPPLGPLGFGLRGTVRLRAPGSFSGFGVTGPSTYSKPIFSALASSLASSLTSTTRTWPPPFSLPKQHLVRQRLLDVLLDHPGHRPRAHLLVVAMLDQPGLGRLRQFDGDVAVGELRLELQHELLHHHADHIGIEMRERDDGIEPVAEFRRELAIDRFVIVALPACCA